MRNVGAEGFFERNKLCRRGKGKDAEERNFDPENFLSGRKGNTFATVLKLFHDDFKLSY